nr:unnamed protein product [Digitaria exilis]
MDLNASPLPEDDEQQPYHEVVEVEYAQEEHVESAVATMRREREERRKKLKREHQDDGSRLHSQQIRNDYVPQTKRYSRIKEAPQGWLDCPAFGEPIDKIIPSKVPLDETFNESVPPGKRYSSKQLVNKQRKAGREIGLVIDLTNTTRYYSPAEWTRQGTKHVKIPCKGRDAVPDNESVNVFVYEAINIFAQRRPPGIYKRDYIEALYSFYHEVPENMIACPPTPEWKRPDDLDLNGEAKQDDDDDNGEHEPPNNESVDKVITNDDVLGDAVPYDQQEALRVLCYRLLDMPLGLHDMTLVDGEMIIDTVPESGLKRRYLAYDLMALDAVSKTKLPFSERWRMLEDEIIRPRYHEKKQFESGAKSNPFYKYDMELFSVRRKDFWLLSTVTKLLKEFIPKLCHDADGLIFQGWDDPYVTRTHEGLLKWKYPEMNSVDFLFEVMRSITDNITEVKLLEEIDEIRRLPMYADRIAQAHAKMAQHRRR